MRPGPKPGQTKERREGLEEQILKYTGPRGTEISFLVSGSLESNIIKGNKAIAALERELGKKSEKVLRATGETHTMKQRRNLRVERDRVADELRGYRNRVNAMKEA